MHVYFIDILDLIKFAYWILNHDNTTVSLNNSGINERQAVYNKRLV